MHRLALSLGYTIAELDERLSSSELTDWMAYYQLEPWGSWRDNWHAALIAKLTYDVNRGKQPPAKMQSFMFSDAEVDAEMKAKKFAAQLNALAGTKK